MGNSRLEMRATAMASLGEKPFPWLVAPLHAAFSPVL